MVESNPWGRVTATRLGLGVGDQLALEGPEEAATFRVVGIAVVPGLGINVGVGEGAVLTFGGARRVAPDVAKTVAAVVLAPDAAPDTRQRLGALTAMPPGRGTVPGAIRNVARVQSVPLVLSVLLAWLTAVLLTFSLFQSVRARARDHAVLRSLGADRAVVARAVRWQATALLILPLLIGVPVGVLIGRGVFRAFVGRIGAVPDPTTPVLLAVLVVAGGLVLANIIAVLAARRARRAVPALLLRTE